MASLYFPDPGIPNIIVIGVPNQEALHQALAKLERHQIPHCAWTEPDYDYGLTAIATVPLDQKQRCVLSNYGLWRFAGGGGQPPCRVMPDSRTNSAEADLAEESSSYKR
jgi:hypothetical protein